nr:immunoglobulin heavy chain junction region [Macaca mulatta]
CASAGDSQFDHW